MVTDRVNTEPAEPTEAALRQVRLAVLAKAPITGLAKTRLIPALGAAGAARLQRQLTRSTLATAGEAGLGPLTLWCAPDAQHRFFRALQQRCGVRCRDQPAGDLGQRMHAAFCDPAAPGPLLLIGTDCPPLRPAHLVEAAAALLQGDDAVFIPAEDGGYVLVGLRQPQPGLFEQMTWSTDQVMADTRRRARALSLRWRELPPLWDLDLPADLDRWRQTDSDAAHRLT
jgi:hypothetical protein